MLDRIDHYTWYIIGLLFLLMLIVIYYNQPSQSICHKKYVSIIEVGGCNMWGDCGVLLSNGNTRVYNKPVVGEKREVCELH